MFSLFKRKVDAFIVFVIEVIYKRFKEFSLIH
jgi:hypothetical protein